MGFVVGCRGCLQQTLEFLSLPVLAADLIL